MRVTINGEAQELAQGTSILSLLETLDLKPGATVVQLNADIVDRADFAAVTIAEGDTLELVRFVGGG
jgi:thiamine biosynthesis protein ThiS